MRSAQYRGGGKRKPRVRIGFAAYTVHANLHTAPKKNKKASARNRSTHRTAHEGEFERCRHDRQRGGAALHHDDGIVLPGVAFGIQQTDAIFLLVLNSTYRPQHLGADLETASLSSSQSGGYAQWMR